MFGRVPRCHTELRTRLNHDRISAPYLYSWHLYAPHLEVGIARGTSGLRRRLVAHRLTRPAVCECLEPTFLDPTSQERRPSVPCRAGHFTGDHAGPKTVTARTAQPDAFRRSNQRKHIEHIVCFPLQGITINAVRRLSS